MRWPTAALWAGILWAGCAGPSEIPRPDLRGVEPQVREAVAADQQLVLDAPDSPAAWGRLGDRYRAQQWLAQAAPCYEQAARLEPGNFRWPYLLAKSSRFDRPEVAADAFRRSLAIDPNYPPAHLFLGQTLIRLGHLDEAREHFETAERLDPGRIEATLELGRLELSQGRLEAARAYLNRVLEADPSHGGAHLALSQVALAMGEPDLAERHAALARRTLKRPRVPDPRAELSVAPAGSWGLAKRGKDLVALGRVDEALPLLEEAIRINPELVGPRVTLGLVLMIRGRLEEASGHLRQALWLQPDHAEAHAALGNLLILAGATGLEEAVAHLREAVRLDPENGQTRYRLAIALIRSGQLEDAVEQLTILLRADPDFAEARWRLGLLLIQRRQVEAAEIELRRALEIVKRDLVARAASAEEHPPGPREVRRILALQRLSSAVHEALAGLLREKGENEEAARHLAEARRSSAEALP